MLMGGAAVVWPLAARAQPGERVRHVGVLIHTTSDEPQAQAEAADGTAATGEPTGTDGQAEDAGATTGPESAERPDAASEGGRTGGMKETVG